MGLGWWRIWPFNHKPPANFLHEMAFHDWVSRHRPPKPWASLGAEGAQYESTIYIRREEELGFQFWKPRAGSSIGYMRFKHQNHSTTEWLGLERSLRSSGSHTQQPSEKTVAMAYWVYWKYQGSWSVRVFIGSLTTEYVVVSVLLHSGYSQLAQNLIIQIQI